MTEYEKFKSFSVVCFFLLIAAYKNSLKNLAWKSTTAFYAGGIWGCFGGEICGLAYIWNAFLHWPGSAAFYAWTVQLELN